MPRNASEIYDDLKSLSTELESLAKAGLITMSMDTWDKDYPDTNETGRSRLNLLPTWAQQKLSPYGLFLHTCG